MIRCGNTRADLPALAEAAAGGDREAVAELLTVLRPRIVRYCRARINAHHSHGCADDVAQEVMLAALTALPRFRHEGNGFDAFVFGIAAHKVADFHRGRTRDRTTAMAEVPEVSDDRAGPEQAALRAEQRQQMRRLLANLTDAQREIIVLRLAVGMTSEEAARVLSSTPGAVRVAQHRALEKLRRLLQQHPDSA